MKGRCGRRAPKPDAADASGALAAVARSAWQSTSAVRRGRERHPCGPLELALRLDDHQVHVSGFAFERRMALEGLGAPSGG